jgi:hypothetical protein
MAELKEQLKPNEGGILADAFGRFVVRGHQLFTEDRKRIVALGEGPWEGPVKVYHRANELNLSDTAVVHFAPGNRATSFADPNQSVSPFFPSLIPYSRTAILSVNIPSGMSDPTDSPDDLKSIMDTRILPDYDETGTVVGNSYSQNPARVTAWILLKVMKLPASRVNWAKWVEWRDWCDFELTWTNLAGDSKTTPRFRCNMAFVSPTAPTEALEYIQLITCSIIQDDGEQYQFFWPGDGRVPVHTFTAFDNVVNYKVWRTDQRERPVYLRARYRDLETEFLEETTWLVVDDEELSLADTVAQPAELRLASCDDSQASRILRFQLGLKSKLELFVELRALGDSYHVLPGDLVVVNLPAEGIAGKVCLVLESVDESPESSAGERTFRLQEWDPSIYSDEIALPNEGVSTRTPPLALAAVVTGTSIALTWTRNSATNTGVEVWVDGARIAALDPDVETYTHVVTYNGNYSIKVRNMYSTGGSAFAGPVTASVTAGQTEPGSGGGGGGTGGGGGGGWDGRRWDGILDLLVN